MLTYTWDMCMDQVWRLLLYIYAGNFLPLTANWMNTATLNIYFWAFHVDLAATPSFEVLRKLARQIEKAVMWRANNLIVYENMRRR